MSDQTINKPNNDDLSQVKSLIGDATGEDFSLDDILAEFGTKKKPLPPRISVVAGQTEFTQNAVTSPTKLGRIPKRPSVEKVVAFPSTQPPGSPTTEHTFPPQESSEMDAGEGEDFVIPFPEAESVLGAFLKDMGRKADDYADRMFEEDEHTDPEQVRRLERLIPGTDREEAPAPRQVRPPRPPEPLPPDTPPQELAGRYHKGLRWLRVRTLLVCVLAVMAGVQCLIPALGVVWPAPLASPALQSWMCVTLLGLGTLLSLDLLAQGLLRAFRGKVGMDTLLAFSCAFTLADGVVLALGQTAERLPLGLVALWGIFFLLHGSYHKRYAQRLSCRVAAASSKPYRVTLDEGKWNGRDTYTKWVGATTGFGSQMQGDDGAQRIFTRYAPVLLVGAVVLALLASVGTGQGHNLLWALSALFTAVSAFGGALAYGRPFHKVASRLFQSGAALGGWPGVARCCKGNRVLITDTDLFPPGYVMFNGYKVLGSFSAERVVAYTATLIRDSGSGLTKVFHDQLRSMGGLMRHSQELCCYEAGGLGAEIRGDQVQVGCASFMNLMEVSLPQGLNVRNAVFCAINGELAGIFALNYSLPDTVFPALISLMDERVGPVLATRDFNLIPAMLQQRFKLASDRMDFPPVERRRELSDPAQPHSEILTALLCREGLFPFAESIAGARRLGWATRVGAVLCCIGSTMGLLLSTYLVSMGAYTSLSPLNLLVFMLTWLVPVWFISGWVHRY